MSATTTVMSGMRPTGRLHLGNYWGALKRWVELQKEHRCFFMVADFHMFTTGYEETGRLKDHVREMVLDWLAAGLDPERCVMFRQSAVPQHAELTLLLSMVTPISWLENNPTYKEQLQELAKTKLTKASEEGGILTPERRAALAGQTLEPVEPEGEGARKELNGARLAPVATRNGRPSKAHGHYRTSYRASLIGNGCWSCQNACVGS